LVSELLFGSPNYTTKVDMWSAGCVFAHILLGRPIFAASTNCDQLVEVIKVLGTPNKTQIGELNKKYLPFDFPLITAVPLHSAFGAGTPEDAIDLLSKLLEYIPSDRIHPMVACLHPYFDKLREKGAQLPNGNDLPPLFNFTDSELRLQDQLKIKL
jgi:serine/threonine protein kinase